MDADYLLLNSNAYKFKKIFYRFLLLSLKNSAFLQQFEISCMLMYYNSLHKNGLFLIQGFDLFGMLFVMCSF